jgi:myo-inositol 2-dehydrogenase/D-chiro-inositol 1-dehydrogenase
MREFKVSRRLFLAGAGALAAAPTVVRGQGQRVFKFALVGCGGRGSGAARDIVKAAERLGHKAVLVAAADFFVEKAQAVCKVHGCDEKAAFGGADGYKQALASDAEIVLLAAPPLFRPLHAEACVKAGKHIFAEKPIATDPAGVRRFLQVVEAAKAAKLSILSGTVHRHNSRALRQLKPVRDGVIGEIRGGMVYRCQGAMSPANYLRRRRSGDTDASYMANNWYHFREMSSDHLCEQAVHEIDLANWFIGRLPEKAMGIGARHRRSTGNTYDCFGIDYDYGNGLHIHAVARQINGCFDRCCTLLSGTTGQIDLLGSKILRPDGKTETFPFDEQAVAGRDDNLYMMEHADFLSGLLSGNLLQEGEQVAMATATGLLGTLAAYTGQMVRLSDLLTNTESPFYSMNHGLKAEDFESGNVVLPLEGRAALPGQPEKAE